MTLLRCLEALCPIYASLIQYFSLEKWDVDSVWQEIIQQENVKASTPSASSPQGIIRIHNRFRLRNCAVIWTEYSCNGSALIVRVQCSYDMAPLCWQITDSLVLCWKQFVFAVLLSYCDPNSSPERLQFQWKECYETDSSSSWSGSHFESSNVLSCYELALFPPSSRRPACLWFYGRWEVTPISAHWFGWSLACRCRAEVFFLAFSSALLPVTAPLSFCLLAPPFLLLLLFLTSLPPLPSAVYAGT